jgi:hypothetical protein
VVRLELLHLFHAFAEHFMKLLMSHLALPLREKCCVLLLLLLSLLELLLILKISSFSRLLVNWVCTIHETYLVNLWLLVFLPRDLFYLLTVLSVEALYPSTIVFRLMIYFLILKHYHLLLDLIV